MYVLRVVLNVGNLYGSNTIELLKTRKAMEVRNETIVKLLETLGGIIENRHTGITTMQKKMKNAGLPEPVFTNEREDFVVTFYNGEYLELYLINSKETQKTQDKGKTIHYQILKFCEEPKSLLEIMDKMGYKSAKDFRKNYIKPLVESGKLKMTVPEKLTSRNQKYISSD